VIDRELKRSLGQMMKGVQVVGASHDGVSRAYCSHWICQVSFDEPILMASVSRRHDTHPLIAASGRFSVSILAGDQVEQGQYFSYPGRRFRYVAGEFVDEVEGLPRVRDCIAWLGCTVIDRRSSLGGSDGWPATELDHDLFFARVTSAQPGRLGEPPLVYSSRAGWRIGSEPARHAGDSVRDRLLARLGDLDATDDATSIQPDPEART
jgi:flavin reductase (DIM6/NTAB) family NADH-FMN oxidoreductase RutF